MSPLVKKYVYIDFILPIYFGVRSVIFGNSQDFESIIHLAYQGYSSDLLREEEFSYQTKGKPGFYNYLC